MIIDGSEEKEKKADTTMAVVNPSINFFLVAFITLCVAFDFGD